MTLIRILINLKTYSKNSFNAFNPHTPVAQKVANKVVFRRFQVEFFKSDLTGPLQIFDLHLFEDTN